MRIAIVDDCESERNELYERLLKNKFLISYDVEIHLYNSGSDFLNEALQNRFDLVFLDIYMNDENGIETAQKLRAFDRKCLLVFTTTSTDHALDGFSVRALHYLVKPYSNEELEMLLDEISQKIPQREKYIQLPSHGDNLRIRLCDILYAEHFKHCIHIFCTDNSEKIVRSTFSDFTKLFENNENFFVCSRGILVNLEHIKDINGNEFILDNNTRITISRSLIKSAKNVFGEYLFNRRDSL